MIGCQFWGHSDAAAEESSRVLFLNTVSIRLLKIFRRYAQDVFVKTANTTNKKAPIINLRDLKYNSLISLDHSCNNKCNNGHQPELILLIPVLRIVDVPLSQLIQPLVVVKEKSDDIGLH